LRPGIGIGAICLLGIGALETSAATAQSAAPGYALETVSRPGAMFCGLDEEPGALLVTNLADGRLYRRNDATGELAPFGPELPHGVDIIGDPAGPYRVAPHGGGYLVAQGWTPVDAGEDPRDHALLIIDANGETRILDKDFWNPFAFVAVGETIYVVDAARNTVERLGRDGKRDTVAAFPRIEHSGSAMRHLSPTEFAADEAYEVDAVPTGIAARDGRLLVSLFGGFPYVAGGGAIVSIDPETADGDRRVEVDGLEAPVGVAFLAAGELLVLEHGMFHQASGFVPGTGRLLLVGTGGERVALIDGLTRPTSVLVRESGTVAVAGLDGKLLFLTREPTGESK
jgi:hypothetical protein